MSDYEYIFTKSLHAKLKNSIFASVYVKVDDDVLEVLITRKEEEWVFKMEIPNLSQKILSAYSSECAAQDILNKYKKFIQNMTQRKYFKQEVG